MVRWSGSRARSRLGSSLVVLAVVAAGCGGGSSSPQSATSSTSEPSPATSAEAGDGTGAAEPASVDVGPLAAGGIQIVAGEGDLERIEAPVIVTDVQARRMMAELAAGGGIVGADLDAMAPVPEGIVPMSYLVAGWINTATTPAGAAARDWMGDQDWPNAPSIVFPSAVLALFANDMALAFAAAANEDADDIQFDVADLLPTSGASGADGSTPTSAQGFRAVPAAAAPAGPCSVVQNFVTSAFAAITNALHIKAVNGDDVASVLLNGVIAAINFGVGLATGAVKGLIDLVSAPVLDAIRIGVATVAMVTIIRSFLSDQTLTVQLVPGQGAQAYRFAIGADPDVKGAFVASGPDLTGDWPPALLDCAVSTGVTLPKAIGAGSAATWVLRQPTPVIAAPDLSAPVAADLTARLDFTTGREPEEHRGGEAQNSVAEASVRIPRTDVREVAGVGRDLVNGALKSLSDRLVIPGVKEAALAALHAIIDPLVAQLESAIVDGSGQLLALTGTGRVFVEFHSPVTTTTVAASTTVTSEAPDDFCTLFRSLMDFTAANQGIAGTPAWSAEIVGRLQEMGPVAPVEVRSSWQAYLDLYVGYQQGLGAAELGVLALPIVDAGQTIAAFCGFALPG